MNRNGLVLFRIFVQRVFMNRLVYSLLILTILSCGESPFYSEVHSLNEPVWPYDKEIPFDVLIKDTSSIYEMQLVVEHKRNYRYENIYFRINTDFPSLEDREELLNIDLASKAGQWMGKCGSNNCKTKIYLLDSFKFPEPGNYAFEFAQYTRQEELEGIVSLQLLIYKTRIDEKT